MNASSWLRPALAILLCSTSALMAQNETGQEPPRVQQVDPDGNEARGKERGKGGKDGVLSEEEEKNLTPEQRLARSVTSGAGAYCRFVGALIPPKLMPGQQGIARVAVAMLGAAVLPSPPQLELLSQANMGVVSIGGMSLHPAEPGVMAAGYRGRPVYENTMVLEIPVTMSADAKLGEKVQFSLDFRFDLYDGASAQPIGRFIDRALVEGEVGLTPDPAVPDLGRKETSVAPASKEQPVASAPVASTGPAPVSGVDSAKAPTPAVPTPEVQAAAPSTMPPTDDGDHGGAPMVLIAGCGLALLVLILLVVRKK